MGGWAKARSERRESPRMPRDPFIREKFTRECSAARKLVAEYYRRFPKDCYQTEVESWRDLQAANSSLL
jgi:hypothetical protein